MGSSDRRPYDQAGRSLSQALLDECAGNLSAKLEMICTIVDVGSDEVSFYLSDRAKYVYFSSIDASIFYQPRVTFPQINRTLGDFLSSTLELSSLQVTINNSDQYFNTVLPGGDLYNGFINKVMIVEVGIGEDAANYHTIFAGHITKVGGFSRDYKSFKLTAKNKFEVLNTTFPDKYLSIDAFEFLDDDLVGVAVPVILGDWTVNLARSHPSVPGLVVNGKNPLVNKSIVDINGDPDPNVGSARVQAVISINPLSFLDTSKVYLKRSDVAYIFDSADIEILAGLDNRFVYITQGNLQVNEPLEPWIYEDGDEFFFEVKGTTFDSPINIGNPLMQAKKLLMVYAGRLEADFDSSWATYITRLGTKGWLSRCWVQDQQPLFEYILSLLEQVRLEVYINNDNKLAVTSLWMEDFIPAPSFRINNFDIIRGTLKPILEDRNVFNSAKAEYSFDPSITQNRFSTAQYSNELAVTQMGSKIAKLIVFPNLYIESHVLDNLTEILRLIPYIEFLECSVTPRSLLLELGQQIGLNINVGGFNLVDKFGVLYNDMVTGIVRSLGFDPKGMSIPIKVWMLQMVAFPNSLKIDVAGKIAGYNIAITKD
jgi:hypothetical protein